MQLVDTVELNSESESVETKEVEEGSKKDSSAIKLRDYQITAISNLRATLAQGVRRVVLQLPTGGGKTLMAAEIACRALARGKRVAFVVPALSLIDQAVEDFYEAGIRDIGVIQADHWMTDPEKQIQVCSVQTLARRRGYPPADLVFFDECHRLFALHLRWLADPTFANVPFIGLSATPWARGLGKYYETLLIAETVQGLIDAGYLSRFRVFATGHPDLAGVRDVAGDYHEGDLSAVMQGNNLVADIITTWKERCEHHDKTLCFAVDRLHAKSLQERFTFTGVRCGYQDAETPPSERREIKKKFHSGELQVVVNIGTLTTGIDWDVRCLILARPTKSEMLFAQIIGRALRRADGKDYALILDHSDTTKRLGFVTDLHHDALDMGKRLEKKVAIATELLPVDCEDCGYIMPRRLLVCPNCGKTIEPPKCHRLERDGVLYEMERDGSCLKASKIPAHLWTKDERLQFFTELKFYAQQRGYKDGWAPSQYRQKFGDYPPGIFKYAPPARFVSPTVKTWIKSRMIAWAKVKQKMTQ